MPTGRTAFQRKPPLYGHYAAIRQTGEQFMDQATLMDKIKTGTTLCKAIMRNGYDAYAINAPLQGLIFEKTGVFDVDIACACDTETLFKIFPNAVPYTEEGAMAMLQENGVTLRFYSTDVEDASHPEMSQLRITPRLARLLAELQLKGQLKSSNTNDPEAKEFEDFDKAGSVKLVGLPSKTLAKNYLLAIRALRYAANFDLPVNPHTWVSIIQSANRILDYVPAREIMEEWRKVAAESMWKFVQLLFEAQLLHGLMPEIAALSCIKQERNDDGDIESVFDHTIECMKRYPEEGFSMDWYGTLATMFHDVGKLYTAEHLNGRWTFYQHHRVGAGVTRKILRRLRHVRVRGILPVAQRLIQRSARVFAQLRAEKVACGMASNVTRSTARQSFFRSRRPARNCMALSATFCARSRLRVLTRRSCSFTMRVRLANTSSNTSSCLEVMSSKRVVLSISSTSALRSATSAGSMPPSANVS